MNEKVVTVVTTDGKTTKFNSDAVIVFALNQLQESHGGKSNGVSCDTAYIGKEIPKTVFNNVIASLIVNFVKEYFNNNPADVSYQLFSIIRHLEKAEEDTRKSMTPEQMDTFVKDTLKAILENMFK